MPTEDLEANAGIQLVLTGTKNDTHIERVGTYEELERINYQETLSVSFPISGKKVDLDSCRPYAAAVFHCPQTLAVLGYAHVSGG